ncbi:MAG: sigma-54 dependent transcriptional regulator [Bacteroidota bacterium]
MAEKLIYIVEDEPSIATILEFTATRKWGCQARVFPNGELCLQHLDPVPDLILLDVMMPGIGGVETLKEIKRRHPDIPVIILSAQGRIEVALETIKIGAVDYFTKPVDFAKLEIAVRNIFQLADLTLEVQQLRESIEKRVHFDNIISGSGEMQEIFTLINKVKDSDMCVLVLGESGTGKELIARAIHYNGNRKSGPFVVVNCASIPRDLLESEFFGHEKGSFTGAFQRRIGKFEQANGGTVFLDEIGDLDIVLQAKILRVIQSKQFERVGGNETLTTDTRLISATNRDLGDMVRQKLFREDLYFRLAMFPILIPPLRQRRSDILLLAEHFLKRFMEDHHKTGLRFSRKALKILYEYPWPGNVRELEHAIQRSVVMVDSDTITERELPMSIQTFAAQPTSTQAASLLFTEGNAIVPLDKVKEATIRHALRITNGNIVEAAEKLKIGRATLYRLMKKYKIAE